MLCLNSNKLRLNCGVPAKQLKKALKTKCSVAIMLCLCSKKLSLSFVYIHYIAMSLYNMKYQSLSKDQHWINAKHSLALGYGYHWNIQALSSTTAPVRRLYAAWFSRYNCFSLFLLINMMLNFSIAFIRRNEEKQLYFENHATYKRRTCTVVLLSTCTF